MKRIAGLLLALLPGLFTTTAHAENARIFGRRLSPMSETPGAFVPAATSLTCYSLDNGRCWDGKKWHRLYPKGPRSYAKPKGAKVACSVIVEPSNDCWTGAEWYRLPAGNLFGIVGGFASQHPSAFITAPLR